VVQVNLSFLGARATTKAAEAIRLTCTLSCDFGVDTADYLSRFLAGHEQAETGTDPLPELLAGLEALANQKLQECEYFRLLWSLAEDGEEAELENAVDGHSPYQGVMIPAQNGGTITMEDPDRIRTLISRLQSIEFADHICEIELEDRLSLKLIGDLNTYTEWYVCDEDGDPITEPLSAVEIARHLLAGMAD
jgi:hypothetical protein